MGEEKKLGAALQAARQNKKWTQQELCQKADLSYSTLTKIERGAIKSPSIFTVASLASQLDISLDQLMSDVLEGYSAPSLSPAPTISKLKTAKNGIRFVYFDINGCLVEFFQDAFLRISEDFGVSAGRVESAFWRLNDSANRGQIDSSELNKRLSSALSVDGIINWSKYYLSVVQPIQPTIDLLTWASQNYQVGLLSNINEGIIQSLLDASILPKLDYSCIIDSSEAGMIKPEPEIFQLAIKKSGVSAREILLIDDNRDNIVAAQSSGMRVCWFDSFSPQTSVETIRQELEF